MKIASIEFTPAWSWGLIFTQLEKKLNVEVERYYMNNNDKIYTNKADVIMAQNVTLLKKFQERLRTVCRMGGNQNFDTKGNLEPLLNEMAKCYCLVATNQKLYDIASAIHDNVYLIPNGIDLKEWAKVKKDKRKKFTVGFCGNISSPQYKEYKGYDFVKEACDKLGIELKTALYLDKQIPHDEMREKFYSQIDCIVHPTLGEGCSNTLMEACACGVPIITTKVAGYHGELMKDDKDVLFCERSTKSIEKQIKLIKNDNKLKTKLSKGSRKFAESHHDINEIAKEYEKIFTECYDNIEVSTPEILFFGITKTPRCKTATFNINGKNPQSKKFPVTHNKEQMIIEIAKEYNRRKECA